MVKALETIQNDAEEWLEVQMRRYIYDRSPDRRIWALDRYREMKGLGTWAEKQIAHVKALGLDGPIESH